MATEKVRIRNSHLDNWQAFYMGKWRKVFINVKRTFIMYGNERITILIEGV